MIGGSIDAGTESGEKRIWEGIDWPRLEALVADPAGEWYYELVGHDAYERLQDL